MHSGSGQSLERWEQCRPGVSSLSEPHLLLQSLLLPNVSMVEEQRQRTPPRPRGSDGAQRGNCVLRDVDLKGGRSSTLGDINQIAMTLVFK